VPAGTVRRDFGSGRTSTRRVIGRHRSLLKRLQPIAQEAFAFLLERGHGEVPILPGQFGDQIG
jgi:hypothetical protein